MKKLYWSSTMLFALILGVSGFGDLMGIDKMRAAILTLGYPDYFRYIIGTAKVLGVIALLFPFPERIKEWGYAGFTFNLVGAIASHIASAEDLSHLITPVLLLIVMSVSYVTFHRQNNEK